MRYSRYLKVHSTPDEGQLGSGTFEVLEYLK